MRWYEVYKLPLRISFWKVYSSNHVMAFDFCNPLFHTNTVQIPEHEKETLVKVLNWLLDLKIKYDLKKDWWYILLDWKRFLFIRWWWYLTWVWWLNLSAKEAEEIQKDFLDYIFKKLKW